MKHFRFLYLIILFSAALPLFTQSKDDKWDINTIFDESDDETGQDANTRSDQNKDTGQKDSEKDTGQKSSPADSIKKLLVRKGFTFDASTRLFSGVTLGWTETPWNWETDGRDEFDGNAGIGMSGSLGLNFQFSDVLRVKNTFSFEYPGYAFTVSEFFVDYNFFNRVYFRAGKTGVTWGQSRNYTFTNLPARLPQDKKGGDSIIVKADMPIGIGGFQLLALTRPGFMQDGKAPTILEIGYGAKYNLASKWVDADFGLFFHEKMPLRSFLSLKTTIKDTELYADAMYALQYRSDVEYEFWDRNRGAFSIGAEQDFFTDKLTLNLELLYNNDTDSNYYQEKDDLRDATTNFFIEGWNGAINIIARPVNYKSFRIFAKCLYSFGTNSAWLVPGISIAPVSHITAYLTVPMALGPSDGPYYHQNDDMKKKDRSFDRPFRITLGIRISGNYSVRYYE
ncbi:hypothetical protein AGMMS50293_18700 [Spirochaetia bacterium]|nr:hypothetical protein AGMMS50293_18700 [Spirochaetia bacterium]